jgi:hypothetical protein
MSTLHSNVGIMGYLLRVVPLGIGLGLFLSPNNSAIMGAAPPERLGVASGLLSLMRSLGQTTGMPIMGAIFTSTLLASAKMSALKDITAAPAEALVSGIASAYRIGAVLIFTSILLGMTAVMWVDKKRKANQKKQEESEIGLETSDLR